LSPSAIREVPDREVRSKPTPLLKKETRPSLPKTEKHIDQTKTAIVQSAMPSVSSAQQALSDFGDLLKKGLFDDAMELYMDADEGDVAEKDQQT